MPCSPWRPGAQRSWLAGCLLAGCLLSRCGGKSEDANAPANSLSEGEKVSLCEEVEGLLSEALSQSRIDEFNCRLGAVIATRSEEACERQVAECNEEKRPVDVGLRSPPALAALSCSNPGSIVPASCRASRDAIVDCFADAADRMVRVYEVAQCSQAGNSRALREGFDALPSALPETCRSVQRVCDLGFEETL